MKKFNWIDGAILVLVIAVAAGGWWYLNRNAAQTEGAKTKIAFTVNVSRVPIEVVRAYSAGEQVTFGTKNVDKGVISKVEYAPYAEDRQNPQLGQMQSVVIPDLYNAYVTIETDGTITEHVIKSSQENINVGVEMIFHGKGFAGKGYITQIKEGE